jgi:type III secretory pathway component EscU
MAISIHFLISNKSNMVIPLDKLTIFFVALSLALATFFMGFYYWVNSMTYISPLQNYTIVPVLGNILQWMHQIIL